MHARPATIFVEVASRFASEIRVQHNGRAANGKSLASLLKLGVESGQPIQILAVGADADAALIALREAVESGLGDEDTPEQIATSERLWAPLASSRAIVGVPGSPGLAIGALVWAGRRARKRSIKPICCGEIAVPSHMPSDENAVAPRRAMRATSPP